MSSYVGHSPQSSWTGGSRQIPGPPGWLTQRYGGEVVLRGGPPSAWQPSDGFQSTKWSPEASKGVPESVLLRELRAILQAAKPHATESSRQRECLRVLSGALNARLGPQWRVCPFGSAKNLCMTRGSDLDVTLYTCNGEREGDMGLAWQELQGRVLPALLQSGRFGLLEAVHAARIPVLKLSFDGALDVDLSCHNIEAIRNTQLLRAYMELDPLVPDLVVLVKQWAKGAGVCGSQKGHLTSYALTLMAVFFLQVHPKFKLPCLPTAAFCGRGPMPRQLSAQWRCAESLDVALTEFFEFFACDFEWGMEVVTLRLGRRSRRGEAEHARLKGAHICRLHVEDPFLLERNLNCVLGPEQERQLHESLRQAACSMRCGSVPAGLRGTVPAGGAAGPPEPAVAAASARGAALPTKAVAPTVRRGDASENDSTGPGSGGSANASEPDRDTFGSGGGEEQPEAPRPCDVPMTALARFGI